MISTFTQSPANECHIDGETARQQPTLILTQAAVMQLRKTIKEQNLHGHVLAIRIVSAGCNGLGYDFNIIQKPKPDDLVWQQEDITIATDSASSEYLIGTEVDYVKDDLESGFKFSNPNAKSSCGCGTSFAV